MNNKIINCYELDLKQDIPEEMRIVKANCESLTNSNKVLIVILVGIGIGVFTSLVYNFIIKKKKKRKYSIMY